MCTVCGCGEGDVTIEGGHGHSHEHSHEHNHHHHYGLGPARAHAPGLDQARMVQIEKDILGKNDQYARSNRARFAEQGIFTLNLVSSPGSGKTTLLTRTLTDL
ncbi:MAG TPA: hydrogenase accessory protein HypB, partial [Gammaproteobacteria bacterium]|nr:hydrogenase accessory protein HypB [Gammaproteobacteria bacterium]